MILTFIVTINSGLIKAYKFDGRRAVAIKIVN